MRQFIHIKKNFYLNVYKLLIFKTLLIGTCKVVTLYNRKIMFLFKR